MLLIQHTFPSRSTFQVLSVDLSVNNLEDGILKRYEYCSNMKSIYFTFLSYLEKIFSVGKAKMRGKNLLKPSVAENSEEMLKLP